MKIITSPIIWPVFFAIGYLVGYWVYDVPKVVLEKPTKNVASNEVYLKQLRNAYDKISTKYFDKALRYFPDDKQGYDSLNSKSEYYEAKVDSLDVELLKLTNPAPKPL